MLRGGDPVLHDLLELLGRHAGVRGHDDLADGRFAAGERAFHVALEQRGKGLFVFPLGMLRRERLHAIEREEELEIHRLLGPERAVVVEGGDAFGGRDKVWRAVLRDLSDKCDDGFLRPAVVPRRQRIGGLRNGRRGNHRTKDRRSDDPLVVSDFHSPSRNAPASSSCRTTPCSVE